MKPPAPKTYLQLLKRKEPPYRLLICGGRDFDDRVWFTKTMSIYRPEDVSVMICGFDHKKKTFQGADQLALEWAIENNIKHQVHAPDWDAKGLAAGPIRNAEMIRAKPDLVIAWPRKDGSWGAGTMDCTSKAGEAQIPVTYMMRLRAT